MANVSENFISEVLGFMQASEVSQPTVVVADAIKRCRANVQKALVILVSRGIMASERGFNGRGHQLVLYRMAERPLIVPRNVEFNRVALRNDPGRRRRGDNVETRKIITAPATQRGIHRHWLDRAFFGDGPAHSVSRGAA